MSKGVNQSIYVLMLCIFFAGIGVAGGWVIAKRQASSGGVAEEGHAAPPPAVTGLSPQTIKNLGVTVKDAETSEFNVYKTIPATVADSPNSTQPIVSPVAGVVKDVRARQGVTAAAGSVVVTIIRDPFPRAVLKLTEEVIKPASEQVHAALADLRKTLKGSQIFRTELERVTAFTKGTGEPALLPRKTEIDLRYDVGRSEQELANARERLSLHGFSAEQIAELESGKPVPLFNQEIWQRALRKSGLWTEKTEAIYAALPAAERDASWTVAILGELTGMGLATPELADWMKSDPNAAPLFQQIAGLLQQGNTLQQIKSLYAANALNAIVEVVIPAFSDIPDWDIQQVLVKPFDKIEAGAKLLVLSNPRQMFLRAQPAGEEMKILLDAYTKGQVLEAVPLVDGSGPALKGLKVLYLGGGEEKEGTHATGSFGFIPVQNEPYPAAESKSPGLAESIKFRTWKLHEGTRYQLRIAVKTLKDVYVLPADAVAEDGPDKVVYIQNGDSFKAVKIVILYQDHQFAVLDSKHSELFPGDSVVHTGAFALSLALKSSGAAIDPHAGHTH